MRHSLLAAVLLALPFTGARADCPPAADHSDRLTQLIAAVRAAPTEADARPIANSMWELWADAPDARAQAMLDRGMQARSSYDFETANAAFDELIAYCPDYAEGYNQRAFVQFIRRDYVPALADLDRAIARAPRHIAAIAGRGLTLMQLGQHAESQAALREALALNPWLSERRFLRAPEERDL